MRRLILILSLMLTGCSIIAVAQVEKVGIRTTGISCGVCAAVSEMNLKRMEGVESVTISLAKEAITISYKPGAVFALDALREVLGRIGVGVVQFQIRARGLIHEQGAKRLLIAGKDKFVIAAIADAPAVPSDTPVLIEGILNDVVNPREVKVLTFKVIDH